MKWNRRRKGSGGSLALLVCLLLVAGPARGAGEPPPTAPGLPPSEELPAPPPSLSEQPAATPAPVDTILVRGNRTTDTQLVIRTLDLPIGRPFSLNRLRIGERALWSLGLFSAVTISTQPDSVGQRLTVDVVENPRVTTIEFTGNKKIGTEDLKGKLTIRPGQLLTRHKLWESREAVEKAYQDEGYASARCVPEMEDSTAAETKLTMKVEEGPRVKIVGVEVTGNTVFPDKQVRGALSLRPNSLFHRKRYTADRAREDRGRLEDFYRNHGYRDAAATFTGADFRDGGRSVVLRYHIDEGPYYVFGRRTWEGNEAVKTAALDQAAKFRTGDPFSQEKLDQTTAEAYSLYTEKGYLLEIAVNPETAARGDSVDVAYKVQEGRPSHVREIQITGNKHTKERVIRREMTLYPGDLLRRSALLRTQRDVFALGFFEDVNLDYEPTGQSTDVDLVFKVKEKSIGQASGGVGYSSQTGLTGFLQLGHPNLFGNGQSISISLERGGRVNNYEVSFQDPWFFGTPTSAGIDLFNTRRVLDLYTETRRGAALTVGRPWFYNFPDYTHVYLGYSLENYRYSDFDPSLESSSSTPNGIPLADLLRQSSGRISSAYVSFVRNSTDNPFYPTLGSKTTARLTVAGGPLGGDQHFFKPALDHRIYFQPLWKPALMFRWRLGWLVPIKSGRPVPSTETYRLGGTRPDEYLRGYDDYYVVPEENVRGSGSTQVRFPGGTTMFGFTTELQFPIVNPLRGLIFFDAGNTWNRPGEITLSGLKEGIGPGLRFEIPLLGQVGFDYAYGTAVKKWRFHFILGPAF